MIYKKLFPLSLTFALSLLTQGKSATPDVDASQIPWLGTVTLSVGESLIVRQDQKWATVRGAGLQVNDELITQPGATLSLTLFEGPALTLAANSRVTVYESKRGLGIAVKQGEVRVVHGGEQSLELNTPETQLDLGRSIVRVQHLGNTSVAQVEAGVASARSKAQTGTELKVGETYTIHRNNPEIVKHSPSWKIDSTNIRLASAQQSGPRLALPRMFKAHCETPTQQQPCLPIPYCECIPPSTPPLAETTDPNKVVPEQPEQPVPQSLEQVAQQTQPQAAPVTSNQNQPRSGTDTSASTTKSITGPSFSGSSSLSLGSISGSSSSYFSGGLFADAGQQTFQGQLNGNPVDPFPGSIHLVTAERNYAMNSVQLNNAEQAAIGNQSYYSIGNGAPPVGQVTTTALTGSNPTPTTLNLQNFNAHVVKLDQYGVPDPASPTGGGLNSNIGITGLTTAVGQTQAWPNDTDAVIGTAPLVDTRAQFNQRATFALGEFRVSTDGNGGISFAIRRSDQDRLIVKDVNGNDANDLVTTNPDVIYQDAADPRFFPLSTVKAPIGDGTALNGRGTNYSELNSVRKAALTTIMADTLQGYANRTGQTRFVVDGKIIDISGYRAP